MLRNDLDEDRISLVFSVPALYCLEMQIPTQESNMKQVLLNCRENLPSSNALQLLWLTSRILALYCMYLSCLKLEMHISSRSILAHVTRRHQHSFAAEIILCCHCLATAL